jgi:hypothetical protein
MKQSMKPGLSLSATVEKGHTTVFTQTPGRPRPLRGHPLLLLRRSGTGFLAGVFLFALVAPALAAGVTVPGGTKVLLEFAQGLDSRHARKGDRVNLRAREDVTVNGQTVIAKGARATARVMEVRKPRRFGRKAVIKLYQLRVRGVDGRRIQLGQYTSGKRYGSSKAVGAEAGGLVLLGPVGLAAGAFFKGGHLVIKPGTAIDGIVQNATTVRVGAH